MNVIRNTVLGGVAVLFALSAVPAYAAEMPDGVEAVIKQAQEEGASAREARRVARYSYKNRGEAGALEAMETFRKMLKEGVPDREAGKAVMKTERARVRAGAAEGKKESQAVRTEGSLSSGQLRQEGENGDGNGDQVRTRTRDGNGGDESVSGKKAEKQVEKQLADKKQQRLKERKRDRERDGEGLMEERRNKFQHRGGAGAGSGESGKGRR